MAKWRCNNNPKWDSGRSWGSNKGTDTNTERNNDTVASADTDTDTVAGPDVGTKRPLKR